MQTREKPSLARGLPGGGTGLDALGPETTELILLWLLLLIGHGGSSIGRELLQVVLQQADFDAASAHALLLRSVIGGNRRVAHADQIDPVDRDVMIQNQVADDRLGHLLRGGNGGLTLAGGESLDFDDVSALALQIARH